MKQFYLKSLLLLLFTTIGIIAFAYEDVTIAGIKYRLYSDTSEKTAEVRWSNYSGAIAIPSSVDYNDITYSVTNISDQAFSECSALTSIIIPHSVTSIGSWAFRYCSGLTSIIVENGNAHYDARNDCNAIIETSSNTLIAGCQNTIIPNSVTRIGSYAFWGCSGLTSITIPNSVTSIGYSAFSDCI